MEASTIALNFASSSDSETRNFCKILAQAYPATKSESSPRYNGIQIIPIGHAEPLR